MSVVSEFIDWRNKREGARKFKSTPKNKTLFLLHIDYFEVKIINKTINTKMLYYIPM